MKQETQRLTAVAYARFSRDTQKEESITAQFRAIKEYAKEKNIDIVKTYQDDAKSASVFATEERPEFERMLSELVSKKVKADLVLFHKLDRFGRNDYDIARFKYNMRKLGIKIIYVGQQIPDGPEGIILEKLLIGWAEYYSTNLSQEIRKGMKENAIEGKHRGGTPPLGYDVTENGDYVINEKEAEAVKLIFRMVADGEGYTTIIRTLNSRGFKTKRGQTFGKNSIHDILKNEKYNGTYVAGKYSAASTNGKVIKKPNAIPAIINMETWNKVLEIMKKRKHIARRVRKETGLIYLLTGKAFCGKCGGAYTGNSRVGGRNKKSRYNLYNCTKKNQKKTCDNKDIKKEYLENHVLDAIENMFTGNVSTLADRVIKSYEECNVSLNQETQQIKETIVKIAPKIDRLFNAVESGKIDAGIAGPRLNMLAKEKQQLEDRLLEIKSSRSAPLNKKTITKFLEENQQLLANRADQNSCRKIVDLYVDKVILYPEKIKVIFKIPFKLNRGNKKRQNKNVLADVDKDGGPGGILTLSTTTTREEVKRRAKMAINEIR
jgi:site-specific DNA recombinase